MSKVCEICRREAGAGETACAACGSLLQPAEAADDAFRTAPEPSLPRWHETQPGRRPGGPWERAAAPVLIAAFAFVVIGGAWVVGGWTAPDSGGKRQDSSGRVKVGMHISEVGRLLDQGPPPSPSYPRMRDYFPSDEFGDGTIDYEGDGEVLKICFVGGCVTAVEESPSSAGPGFHKYTMIVSQR